MSARRIRDRNPSDARAVRLREALHANSRTISATDPLKERRETLDQQLRDMRGQTGALVESI